MTDDEREKLKRWWDDVNRELEELLAGKVQPGAVDLAARETALNTELDGIEYELGVEYLQRTRRERSEP